MEPLFYIEIDFLFVKVIFEVWDLNIRIRIRRNDVFENTAFLNDSRLLVWDIWRRIVKDREWLWGQESIILTLFCLIVLFVFVFVLTHWK